MSTQHTFAPFNPPTETWESYVARFECFLIANAYTELSGDRKRAYFLGFCGTEMFETARALFAPQSIHTVSWEAMLAKLKDHYAPPPSRCARRYAFYHRNQAEGETVNQFVVALRKAALYCEFYNLEDYLLDRLVFGVRDSRLKRRLLAMHGLTFQIALDEARAAEMSSQSLAEMEDNPSATRRTNAIDPVVDETETESNQGDEVCRLNEAQKKKWDNGRVSSGFLCMGCGGNHMRANCNFKDAICRRCGRRGHIAKVCRAGKPPQWQSEQASSKFSRNPTRRQPDRGPDSRDRCYAIYHNRHPTMSISRTDRSPAEKIKITVHLGGRPCPMEIDTGSAVSIVSWSTLKRLIPKMSKRHLKPCPLTLKDYQGAPIPIIGKGHFSIQYKQFNGRLPLVVVEKPLTSLLGLDWFSPLGLSIGGINSIKSDPECDALVREFPSVFDGKLGTYTGTPISFNLDPQVAPIRLKPRRVPFALKSKVDAELDKLISQGVLQPVDHSRWETPIVTPVKPDGSIRLCADYKCTVNRALPSNAYPVPVVQHLLHSMGRGSIFAKLDLSQAYQQLPVDEAAAEAQTIITHRGAFRCRRLQFGISTAPGIFQSLMERLLHGIPGTVPYFDDVLISAANRPELFARVRAVLSKFQQVGLRVKKEKCSIAVPHVEFLGFLIDSAGIHPTAAKTKAIQDAPEPTNKMELQAFLGLLNFYAVFLPHKASVAEPLHRLLDSGAPWVWGRRESSAFQDVKHLLLSNAVLSQYCENLPLVLACDASPYGVGAVLSHKLPNGSEAPIAFFSRTLASAERSYSQIDKEALATVAGVRRFHHYIYGRHFELVTDHKPLLGLLAGDRQTPQVLSPRMTRWTVFLANYDYTLTHRPGKHMAHADALSRCPLPVTLEDPAPATSILNIEEWTLPVTAFDIAKESAKDTLMSRVVTWVLRGWPEERVAPEFKSFADRHIELSVQKGCLLWGERVVIPPSLRLSVLKTLHRGHPGIVRMKALARSYVWWPGIDRAIEEWVATCSPCQSTRAAPPKATSREWETPGAPWSRIHLDFAGPIGGQMFLVVVDAFSKWLEVRLMSSTTTEAVIKSLNSLFATHGLPDVVVSDNGPQLTSARFEVFLASLGIRHSLIAPWHPASNGMAERMVRTMKDALAKMGPGNWQAKIDELLLTQHTTPCVTTNKSPAELLMGRRLRTTLDRLHPQFTPVKPLDSSGCPRSYVIGSQVYARNYAGDPLWLPGKVVSITGPCSYRVALEDGRLWRRHIDQLRAKWSASVLPEQGNAIPIVQRADPGTQVTLELQYPTPGNRDLSEDLPASPVEEFDMVRSQGEARVPESDQARVGYDQTPLGSAVEPRRSERDRRRPAYLQEYVCANLAERGAVFRRATRGRSRNTVVGDW